MGASVRPDPVQEYLTAKSDPVSDYLAAKGVTPRGASGTWGDEQGPSAGVHLMNAAQGIPGMERLEALIGMMGSRLSPKSYGGKPIDYQTSLNAVRSLTGEIDPGVSGMEKFVGSLATLPFLPANPAAAGAALGGLDRLLNADPVESATGRAVSTAAGAGAGALLGKLTDMAVTAGRSVFAAKPAANLLAKQAERAAAAKRLYSAALAEGKGTTGTQAIQSFLAEPDVAEIVAELQQTRPFQGVASNSPEMLDAVYKTLADRSAQIKKGLEAVSPTRPNIGRFREQDVGAAKEQALTAFDTSMPSYRKAVDDFAKRSKELDAIRRGYEATIKKAANAAPSAKQLTRSTPEAFAEWAGTAKPMELGGASQGILGAVKQELLADPFLSLHSRGRGAASAAGSLLRVAQPNQLPLSQLGLASLYGYTR